MASSTRRSFTPLATICSSTIVRLRSSQAAGATSSERSSAHAAKGEHPGECQRRENSNVAGAGLHPARVPPPRQSPKGTGDGPKFATREYGTGAAEGPRTPEPPRDLSRELSRRPGSFHVADRVRRKEAGRGSDALDARVRDAERHAVRICPEPEHCGGLSGGRFAEGIRRRDDRLTACRPRVVMERF